MPLSSYTYHGKQVYLARDVALKVGLTCTPKLEHYGSHLAFKGRLCANGRTCERWLLTKDGVRTMLMKTRKEVPMWMLEKFEMKEIHYRIVPRETDCIGMIAKSLKSMGPVMQYPVGKYRIDCYFPKYKLAVECDEHDHKDRNRESERLREKTITSMLGCKIVRFNPDAADFDIFKTIDEIIKMSLKN